MSNKMQIYSLNRTLRHIVFSLPLLFRQTKTWSFVRFQEDYDLWDIFDSDVCYEFQVCESTMHVGWVSVRWNILYTDRETEYIYSLTTYEPHVKFTTLLQAQWKTKQNKKKSVCLLVWNIFRKPGAKQVDGSRCSH